LRISFPKRLLWAPIVDSLFIRKLGRRKSWLVPVQYFIGIYMICFAGYTQSILDNEKLNSNGSGSVLNLALIFLFLSFMAATQDITVDGWVND
jgi:MFS transporter, PAT family, solute carrier family 33 (acetyl-CoA transportor), member 1